MKRILIFSLAYYPRFVGGAEVAVKEITDRLGLDDDFDMVTLRLHKDDVREERIGRVNIYRVGFGTTHYLNKVWYIPAAFLKAWKLNRRKKYDLSWAVMSYMGFPALFLKWISGVPFILNLQEGDTLEHVTKRKRIRAVAFLYRRIFKEVAVVQAISSFLADFARDMGYRGRVEVIPNGVDVSRFTRKDSRIKDETARKHTILITTSRLVEKNAVEDIIDALVYLPDNVTLVIAGEGPLEAKLKKQVADLKLEERVQFLGFVPNEELPKYLHFSDIFVRPSLSEGMGISFVEAFAAEIPVIATPVGGIPDFLKDGETGLFCEVHNPKSIAQKVEKLMKDKESRDYIIKNAALVVKRYDWDLISREMQEKVFTL